MRRKRYQHGGYRPRGMVNRGSGRIDPTSPERLPVDDVNAVLGRGEYVVNANAVRAVGTGFLNRVNNIGLNTGNRFQPGQLPGSNYQRGGRVRRQYGGNVRSNLNARPGQYVNQRTGQPYSGPMHTHDGKPMIGATHSSTPHDYLRRVNGRGPKNFVRDD